MLINTNRRSIISFPLLVGNCPSKGYARSAFHRPGDKEIKDSKELHQAEEDKQLSPNNYKNQS